MHRKGVGVPQLSIPARTGDAGCHSKSGSGGESQEQPVDWEVLTESCARRQKSFLQDVIPSIRLEQQQQNQQVTSSSYIFEAFQMFRACSGTLANGSLSSSEGCGFPSGLTPRYSAGESGPRKTLELTPSTYKKFKRTAPAPVAEHQEEGGAPLSGRPSGAALSQRRQRKTFFQQEPQSGASFGSAPEALKLAFCARISFTYLREVLRLLSHDPLHPVLLHVLSQPSTGQRLRRGAKRTVSAEHLQHDFFAREESGQRCAELSAWTEDQRALLHDVGLSPALPGLREAVGQVERLLSGLNEQGSAGALDVLLALLLRRWTATPLKLDVSGATPCSVESVGSGIENDLRQMLDIRLGTADLLSLDWSQSAMAEEVLYTFLEETAAYVDCVGILVSLDGQYLAQAAGELFAREEAENDLRALSSARSVSRTQQFCYGRAAEQKWRAGTDGTWFFGEDSTSLGVSNALLGLLLCSLIVVRNACSFEVLWRTAWGTFQRLSVLKSPTLDSVLESHVRCVGSVFNRGGLSADGDRAEEGGSAGAASTATDEGAVWAMVRFRGILILQTHMIACLGSLMRFSQPGDRINLSLPVLFGVCEFLTDRCLTGLVGDYILRRDRAALLSLLESSPKLITVTEKLAQTSAALIVAVHQLHLAAPLECWILRDDNPSKAVAHASLYEEKPCSQSQKAGFEAFHSLFNESSVLGGHVLRAQMASQAEEFPSFWSATESAAHLALASHALFCTQLVQVAPEARGSVTPETLRWVDPLIREFCAVSAPQHCARAVVGLEHLRRKSQQLSDPALLEAFESVVPDNCPVLWEDDLPSGESVANDTFSIRPAYAGIALQRLPYAVVRCVSRGVAKGRASVLRHVFFDFIEACLTVMDLESIPSVTALLDFLAALFTADVTVACRFFDIRKVTSRANSKQAQGSVSTFIKAPDTTIPSLWTRVVEERLLGLIPYSLPILLPLVTSLLPTLDIKRSTLHLNCPTDRSRFMTVFHALTRPCKHLCSPPGHPGFHPVSGMAQEPNGASDSEASDSYEVQEDGGRCNLFYTFQRGQAGPDDHLGLSLDVLCERVFGFLNHPSARECGGTKTKRQASRWLQGFSLREGTRGSIVAVPFDPPVWAAVPVSPAHAGGGGAVMNARTYESRRYRSYVWAGMVHSKVDDVAQSDRWPIDPETLYNTWEFFDNQEANTDVEDMMPPVGGHSSSGSDGCRGGAELTPNPFCSVEEKMLKQSQKWNQYQRYCLGAGGVPPAVIQWDLESAHCSSPGLLTLFRFLWETLLEAHELRVSVRPDDKESSVASSSTVASLNLLSQLSAFFSTVINIWPRERVVFDQLLLMNVVGERSNENEADTVILQMSPLETSEILMRTLRLGVTESLYCSIQHTAQKIFPVETLRSLVYHALKGLDAAVQPIPLESVKEYLSAPDREGLLWKLWSRECVRLCETIGQESSAYRVCHNLMLQNLGPSHTHLYVHWFVKALLSSASPVPAIEEGSLPVVPVWNLVRAVQWLSQPVATPGHQDGLALPLLLSALHFGRTMTQLSAPVAWARHPLDEALTSAQLTRDYVNRCVRAQARMEGAWGRVDLYLSQIEKVLWQVREKGSCLLVDGVGLTEKKISRSFMTPSILYAVAAHQMIVISLPPPPSSCSLSLATKCGGWSLSGNDAEHSEADANYRQQTLRQMHQTPDLRLFQGFLDLFLALGWKEAASPTSSWSILDRSLLFRAILPVLTFYVDAFSVMNSYLLDQRASLVLEIGHKRKKPTAGWPTREKTAKENSVPVCFSDASGAESFLAAQDYALTLKNFRQIQNKVLNAMAEFDILTCIARLIACDGRIKSVTLNKEEGTGKMKKILESLVVVQRMDNAYLTQAYCWDAVPREASCCSMGNQRACTAVSLARDVIGRCLLFMSSLYKAVLPGRDPNGLYTPLEKTPSRPTVHGAGLSNDDTVTDWMESHACQSAVSGLFAKMEALLCSEGSSVLQAQSECPWGEDRKVSLTSSDLFEEIDRRFLFNLGCESPGLNWHLHSTTFLMGLTAWKGHWGDGLWDALAPATFAPGLMEAIVVSNGMAGSLVTGLSIITHSVTLEHQQRKNAWLMGQLLIKVPPHVLEGSVFREHAPKDAAKGSGKDSVSNLWSLSSRLETTLLFAWLEGFVLIPVRWHLFSSLLLMQQAEEASGVRQNAALLQTGNLARALRMFSWLAEPTAERVRTPPLRESFGLPFLNGGSSVLFGRGALPRWSVQETLIAFSFFWIGRFVSRVSYFVRPTLETGESAGAVPEEHRRGWEQCRLRHDEIALLQTSLQILDIVTHQMPSSRIAEIMGGQIREALEWLVPQVFLSAAGASAFCCAGFYPVAEEVQGLSGWALLERCSSLLISLWKIIEGDRYGNLPSRLPATDLCYAEALTGRLVLLEMEDPTVGAMGSISAATLLLGAWPVHKPSRRPAGVGTGDTSFIGLPAVIGAFGLIVRLVLRRVRASVGSGARAIGHPPKSNDSLPSANLEHPGKGSVVDAPDFVKLYAFLTLQPQLAAHFFEPRASSSGTTGGSLSPWGLANPLLARLLRQWLRILYEDASEEEQGLGYFIPSWLCPTCEAVLLRDDRRESPLPCTTFDCGLNNRCTLTERGLRDVQSLFDLLYSRAYAVPHANRASSTLTVTGDGPGWREPLVAVRRVVFEYAFCNFGRRLWEHVVAKDTSEEIAESFAGNAREDPVDALERGIHLLELSAVISAELHLSRLKHTLLGSYCALLHVSRTTQNLSCNFLSHLGPELNKPFQCFLPPLLQCVEYTLKERGDLLGKSRDPLACPQRHQPSAFTNSFGSLLLYMLQLLTTCAWEADLRAIASGKTTNVIGARSHIRSGRSTGIRDLDDTTPTLQLPGEQRQEDEWGITGLLGRTSSSGTAGSRSGDFLTHIGTKPLANSTHHLFPKESEGVIWTGGSWTHHTASPSTPLKMRGRVDIPRGDSGSSACLSPLWQPGVVGRPPARHPDGVWLLYPLCLTIPPIPNRDVVESLLSSNPGGAPSALGENRKRQLLEDVIHTLWDKLNQTWSLQQKQACHDNLQSGASQDVSSTAVERAFVRRNAPGNEKFPFHSSFQTLADVCQASSVFHVLLRYWIVLTTCEMSQNTSTTEIWRSPANLFRHILEALSTLLDRLLRNEGHDVEQFARVLLGACFSVNDESEEQDRSLLGLEGPLPPIQDLLTGAATFLTASFCCTLLESVASVCFHAPVWSVAIGGAQGTRIQDDGEEGGEQEDAVPRPLQKRLSETPSLEAPASPGQTLYAFVQLALEGGDSNDENEKKNTVAIALTHLLTRFYAISKVLNPTQPLHHPNSTASLFAAQHKAHQGRSGYGGSTACSSSPSASLPSMWVAPVDFCGAFNDQLTLMALSLVGYLSLSETLLSLTWVCQSAMPQIVSQLLATRLYARPLRPGAFAQTAKLLASPHARPESGGGGSFGYSSDFWRPPYERIFSGSSRSWFALPQHMSNMSGKDVCAMQRFRVHPVRSSSHIVWCRLLATLSGYMTPTAPRNISALVDLILRFHQRYCYIFEVSRTVGQLALLEEMAVVVRALSRFPRLSQVDSPSTQRLVAQLVLLALKSARQLAQVCLGRGQIETAEIFKPISLEEMYAADLNQFSPVSFLCGDEPATISSGQAANVPSIFHQRVFVLITKILHNSLEALKRLELPTMPEHLLGLLAADLSKGGGGASETGDQHNYRVLCEEKHTSITALSLDELRSPLGDLLETVFHELMDVGRLVVQLLEDLPKLQKQIFVGICTDAAPSMFLPLALNLHCEGKLVGDQIPPAVLTAATTALRSGDADTTTHHNAHGKTHQAQQGHGSRSFPSGYSSSGVGSTETPPLTPKAGHSGPRPRCSTGTATCWDASSVVSRRSSPLVQRYSSSASRRMQSYQKPSLPIVFYSRIARLAHSSCLPPGCDALCSGVLPELISFSSCMKLLQIIVENSLILSYQLFDRLASLQEHVSPVSSSNPADLSFHASERVGPPTIFARPSVVRRLSEFLTALQSSVAERFRSRLTLFEKLGRAMSVRLGDAPPVSGPTTHITGGAPHRLTIVDVSASRRPSGTTPVHRIPPLNFKV